MILSIVRTNFSTTKINHPIVTSNTFMESKDILVKLF